MSRIALASFLAAGFSACDKPAPGSKASTASTTASERSNSAAHAPNGAATLAANVTATPPENAALPSMEANQSVVVVHDLGFGKQQPNLENVLKEISRTSKADAGQGRTFAILEAFTQPDPATGNINLCLRISSERPGIGEIIYEHPGQKPRSLWKSRITPATHPSSFTGGQLTILFDNGDGKSFTVDGSTGPASIFDAMLKEPGLPVIQAWPDGEIRELSFIYSACGCPIHVKCRRLGDRTFRTDQTAQLIFPDDPAAIQLISRLMKW